MKVFRFVLLFMFLALLGSVLHAKSPWGILTHAERDTTFKRFAIDNLIDGRSIRYAISEDVTPQEENAFKAGIRKWPAEILRFIRESNREQEFKDIIPILERKLTFQPVSLSVSPDIYFALVEDDACRGGVGCFGPQPNGAGFFVYVIRSYREDLAEVSLHEIGHYFGLADQYDDGDYHPEYSSDIDQENGAVMQGKLSEGITCDDADGFINLLDVRLAQRSNGQFSARSQKGWRTLCPKAQNFYQNARTINRKPTALSSYDATVYTVREYDKGKLSRQIQISLDNPLQNFHITPLDEVKKDSKTNRITYVRSVLKGQVNAPKQLANSSASVVWEREFKYSPFTQFWHNGKNVPSIPIQITERINGTFLREWRMYALENGSLVESEEFSLHPDKYHVVTPSYEINFKLRNGEVTEFTIDDNENLFVGHPQKDISVSSNGGKSFTRHALPLNGSVEDWTIYRALTWYELHRDYLTSFYRNFYGPLYEPLFNRHKQQAQKEIKKSLGTH